MEKERFNSYIKVYDKFFSSFKESKISLLEIVNHKNNDTSLWKEYFKNGEIYEINNTDAYNNEVINKRFNNKKFNVIIENGSYDLNSLIKFIKIYTDFLTNNGILLIKNIQSVKYLQILKNTTPQIYHKFIEAYDIREMYGKYDDVIYIINKSSFDEDTKEVIIEEPIEDTKEVIIEEPIDDTKEVIIDEPIEDIKEVIIDDTKEVIIEEPIDDTKEVINEINNEVLTETFNEIIKSNENSYFKDIYNLLFRKIKDDEMILLNIGLNEDIIKYLINTFKNSILFGIGAKKDIDNDIKNNNRIKLYLETSPFDINLESSNIKFNIIISNYEKDIDKITFIINTYSKLLNTNGIMIIEDIEENDISQIRENINQDLKDIMETYKENNKNIIIINK